MAIRRIDSDADLARCFAVIRELRPQLPEDAALSAMMRTMLAEGAQIAALEHEGEVASFALFRIRTMLVSGKTMYVDDLVTAAKSRSQGHGTAMLEWLMRYAKEQGCATFSLDSGTFRHEAHAFYFREGLRITSFHFEKKF